MTSGGSRGRPKEIGCIIHYLSRLVLVTCWPGCSTWPIIGTPRPMHMRSILNRIFLSIQMVGRCEKGYCLGLINYRLILFHRKRNRHGLSPDHHHLAVPVWRPRWRLLRIFPLRSGRWDWHPRRGPDHRSRAVRVPPWAPVAPEVAAMAILPDLAWPRAGSGPRSE